MCRETTVKTRDHICTPNCFRVFRDGKWLKTKVCNKVIAAESAAEHRRRKARHRAWLGPKPRLDGGRKPR